MTINRRDFLKLSAVLTASSVIQPGLKLFPSRLSTDPNKKNILIIVFDALSASNINFHGYPRETMPHLTRLLDRATIYHNHYASSNFTTPGTASLLTGRHPWEHLALKFSQSVSETAAKTNIFSLFDDYYKLVYSHNKFVDYFFNQFNSQITESEDYSRLYFHQDVVLSSEWFTNLLANDPDLVSLFKARLSDETLDGYLYSLIFSSLLGEDHYEIPPEIAELFPEGVPGYGGGFLLEDAIDWVAERTAGLPQPFLGYFHFFPPHAPYRTRVEFIDTFLEDGFAPPQKPSHPIIIPNDSFTYEEELDHRRQYDESILYVDAEFNRLYTLLEQEGLLQNTILVLTSDHGEMFERGAIEHNAPYLVEPLVKVPLIIFDPDQTQRQDIHTLTSAVDLLPTLLHTTGHEIPAELPGQILPGFSEAETGPSRSIYAIDARMNDNIQHITTATLMVRRENWKAIRYSGYPGHYRLNSPEKLALMQIKDEVYYEVFDLENDPDELINLAENPTPEIESIIDLLRQFYVENVEYPERSSSH